MASKPLSQTLNEWLKANLGPRCLAGLTPQDSTALAASIQIVSLYMHTGSTDLLAAFATVVRKMQPCCWQLTYHGIAHLMNWDDRGHLWAAAGLPPIRVTLCKYEPSARRDAVPQPA